MHTPAPYAGDRYLDLDELDAALAAIADRHPRFVRLSELGRSGEGRAIHLLTIAAGEGEPDERPGVWLDGGTHATEWTGVMAALYSATRWVEALAAGDPWYTAWFSRHVAYVAPCISPDGYAWLRSGRAPLRSTTRPPRDERPRVGLHPEDVDGDGRVRWMRWRHPAGPWAFDGGVAPRRRRLGDRPEDAWMVSLEGTLLAWDGSSLRAAPLEHGLDLNRNFPGSWAPFEMFGMDGGVFPLSEPEARAVVDGFRARPRIAAGLTNHTYTGALLTQPYRDPSPLDEGDVRLLEALGRAATAGTGYRVLRTFPDFTYDPKKPIVGVWSDTMSTTFGVPGYTLELWDPFRFAGVPNDDPGKFWTLPDPERCAALVAAFEAEDAAHAAENAAMGGPARLVEPWRPARHPQLGEVEIGGLELAWTMHNPPLRLLPAECERGFTVADGLLRALPDVSARLRVEALGEGLRLVTAVFENHGFLSTSATRLARRVGTAPPLVARLVGGEAVGEAAERSLGWLDGWGEAQGSWGRHPLYPDLPAEGGPVAVVRWTVRGEGPVVVEWDAGRGGRGRVEAG